ncbi:hypothetical protein EYF80_062563 [Liparis tanakae]|uniref:Uncharacterized protein n=1 Tax=Liparis tanakae TaxID=230148 RepID=A0A4Z2EEX0_9TELE|nr:hypothetical protein EYF80_062563 [Liparis tanakae]
MREVEREKEKGRERDSSPNLYLYDNETAVLSSRVVCRVHQSETNLTKFAEIYVPEGDGKSLPTESSDGNSTSSQAEGQNLMSQTDPVQNDTAELRIEVAELKSSLRDKDETIQCLREELRSKQSPVECQHHQPMYPSPGVSNLTNLTPETLPRDVDPKPGNFSQNKDSKPAQMLAPGPPVQRGNVPDHLMHRGAASPAAAPALPAKGKSVSRLRSKSDSLPHSNAAKTKPTNNLSRSTNRFRLLEDLSE